MSGFAAVGLYLVSLFFELIIFTFWLRIALRFLRISSLNPLNQMVGNITNPIIHPILSLFKQKYQQGEQYDWMAFSILILIEFLKVLCVGLIIYHSFVPLNYIVLHILADLIVQPCNLLFYAILIRVVMSYANPGWQHPAANFLRLLTEPLLFQARKLIPNIFGFDFSPFIIMVVLKVIILFINASLPWKL